MLTKAMRKYVMSKDKSGYAKEVYDSRLRAYTIRMIEDLCLIATLAPEKVQSDVFSVAGDLSDKLVQKPHKSKGIQKHDKSLRNSKTLSDFLRLVFTLRINPNLSEQELEKRRIRLLHLAFHLLSYLGLQGYQLAPKAHQLLQQKVPSGIQAILMEAYSY